MDSLSGIFLDNWTLRKVDVLGMGDTYITILPLESRAVNYYNDPEDEF